jgi:hypothetical protein
MLNSFESNVLLATSSFNITHYMVALYSQHKAKRDDITKKAKKGKTLQ